ncbi:MAG: monovalent cation/H+ antiporter complex subunit F [Actinomycetota bacterium]|nr:monovalent cation/H+ antiporter complex subunit F [Actinomycetota bacterium]
MNATVVVLGLAGLGLAAVLALVRLVLGPSVPDRVVALDNLLVVVVAGVAVQAAAQGGGRYLSVVVAAALVGFVGSVTVARYVERRGGR